MAHADSAASSLSLDEKRARGLCAICGGPLTDAEKALEGIGGSYVRCDECVRSIQRGGSGRRHFQWDSPWFPAWVGWSFGSFYLGVSAMPESGFTVGLGFVYLGIGRYDRGWR